MNLHAPALFCAVLVVGGSLQGLHMRLVVIVLAFVVSAGADDATRATVRSTGTTRLVAKRIWAKGNDGATCAQTCAAMKRKCDGDAQSQLTTHELVEAAFAKAGYECKGRHAPRAYSSAPFSTGRGGAHSDDCAPIQEGYESSCTSNMHPYHAPLCACKP